MSTQDLPALNATLNGIAAILLICGYIAIRRGKIQLHKRLMISAFIVSCLFLVSYLVYHYTARLVRFDKPGWVRTVYLWILGTHTPLAAAVPVLAIITLNRALKGRFAKHRAIARWTFPIWLYVSVTGVIIYVLLYHVKPRL